MFEKMYSISERLDKELRKYNRFYELVDIGSDFMIYEVVWGDWKHDHGALTWLVKELFKGTVIETEEYITETDGSDCYSALHRFELRERV